MAARDQGGKSSPANYVERVKALEPSWAIAGFRDVLDARVFDAELIPVFSDESWLDDARYTDMQAGRWPDVPLLAIVNRRLIPEGPVRGAERL